jgi:hypothetical protein
MKMIILKGKVHTGIGDFSKKMEQIPGLLEAYLKKNRNEVFPRNIKS